MNNHSRGQSRKKPPKPDLISGSRRHAASGLPWELFTEFETSLPHLVWAMDEHRMWKLLDTRKVD